MKIYMTLIGGIHGEDTVDMMTYRQRQQDGEEHQDIEHPNQVYMILYTLNG
jgi:hypothetical protein